MRLAYGLKLILMFLATVFLCEIVFYGVLPLLPPRSGERPTRASVQTLQRQVQAERSEPQGAEALGTAGSVVLHPFLGYVLDASKSVGTVNSHGFRGEGEYFPDGPFDFTVMLTGGSTAEHLFAWSEGVLREEISKIPRLAGQRIHIVSGGVFGWKQPQQLLAVAYYLAQGGQIDLLINLDGYNEVVNSTAQNEYARGTIYPAYPHPGIWRALTTGLGDPAVLAPAGEVLVLRRLRRSLAGGFGRWMWSNTATALWYALDLRLETQIAHSNAELARLEDERTGLGAYYRTGPLDAVPAREALDFTSGLWAASSRQLQVLGLGNGFDYFHFLQPNIFIDGSKPLSEVELRLHSEQEDGYAESVRYAKRGQSRLQELGAELIEEGIRFHDFTRVFSEVEETLYIDNCCHFNEHGNHLLARRIVDVIREGLEAADL